MSMTIDRVKELIGEAVEQKVQKSIKPYTDELFEQINRVKPNKMLTGMQGYPEQKLHNFDSYELRDAGGFDNFSHYLKAISEKNYSALENCRVEKDVLIGQSPGSFLIPTKYQAEIIQAMAEKEIIRPLCQSWVLKRGQGETLTVPAIQSYDFSSDKVANVDIDAVAEGGTYGEDTPTVRQVKLKLNKIGKTVDFSEEVIFGSPVDMGSFISGIFGSAAAFKINKLLIKGTGSGEPLGVQNGNDLLTITAETGQDSDTLVAENIFSMAKKLIPDAWATSIFLCSIQNIDQLLKLHVKLGTSAVRIKVFQETDGKFTILGRPCIMNQHMGSLGDPHSLMLCNFKRYAVLTRDGMMIRSDEGKSGENWKKDLVSYKFTMYLDAQPLDNSTVVLADGNEVANFITVPSI
ncbi:phage major capsid protein [Candidatus Atribacteria bacterium 1244-E10-H5-B2]|nr:MAG: phage major capsid protein [Candidatus Atribacteria bacterium 1244-E10-H5-B2]